MNSKIISRFIHRKGNLKDEFDVLDWMQKENYEDELEKIITDELNEAYFYDQLDYIDLSHIRREIVNHEASSVSSRRFSFIPRKFYKYAATVLLLAALSFVVTEYVEINLESKKPNESTSLEIIKSNNRGRKSILRLPDGSIVYLNSESSISYPQKFSDSLRVVELKGEAFFEVAHKENKPFIVHTEQLDIKVIGTSFNVKTYEEMSQTIVSLEMGKVKITERATSENIEKTVVLLPGQRTIFDRENHLFSPPSRFDPLIEYGWKDGILVFENASLQEVVKTLERWYNVDIQLLNKPNGVWQYKAKHQKGESIELVLESMAYNEAFSFDIKENQVTIQFN